MSFCPTVLEECDVFQVWLRAGRWVQPGGPASRLKDRQPERACCGKSGKKGRRRGAEWSVQGHQRRERCSLFRPDRCPDAEAAYADEAGGRLGEGLEEPSRQNCS